MADPLSSCERHDIRARGLAGKLIPQKRPLIIRYIPHAVETDKSLRIRLIRNPVTELHNEMCRQPVCQRKFSACRKTTAPSRTRLHRAYRDTSSVVALERIPRARHVLWPFIRAGGDLLRPLGQLYCERQPLILTV